MSAAKAVREEALSDDQNDLEDGSAEERAELASLQRQLRAIEADRERERAEARADLIATALDEAARSVGVHDAGMRQEIIFLLRGAEEIDVDGGTVLAGHGAYALDRFVANEVARRPWLAAYLAANPDPSRAGKRNRIDPQRKLAPIARLAACLAANPPPRNVQAPSRESAPTDRSVRPTERIARHFAANAPTNGDAG